MPQTLTNAQRLLLGLATASTSSRLEFVKGAKAYLPDPFPQELLEAIERFPDHLNSDFPDMPAEERAEREALCRAWAEDIKRQFPHLAKG